MEGIININKPAGITSHDVVSRVRRTLGTRKVGHAGTLDPLATGVLIVLVGRSTKLFDQFVGFDKGYRATLKLGVKTTSADIMGDITSQNPFEDVTREQIQEGFSQFIGEIDQVPPMVSAVKHKGQRLYKLARRGVSVDIPPRRVRIDDLQILNIQLPYVEFHMECSKGTYVRKLAEDVGDVLGCGACISQIERTRVGDFVIDDAVTLEELNESHLRRWQP